MTNKCFFILLHFIFLSAELHISQFAAATKLDVEWNAREMRLVSNALFMLHFMSKKALNSFISFQFS